MYSDVGWREKDQCRLPEGRFPLPSRAGSECVWGGGGGGVFVCVVGVPGHTTGSETSVSAVIN